MFEVRNGLKYIILLYIAVAFIIYYLKPDIMFDKDKVKKFGIGYGKTVFSYQIVTLFISFILFYFYEVMWLRKNNFL